MRSDNHLVPVAPTVVVGAGRDGEGDAPERPQPAWGPGRPSGVGRWLGRLGCRPQGVDDREPDEGETAHRDRQGGHAAEDGRTGDGNSPAGEAGGPAGPDLPPGAVEAEGDGPAADRQRGRPGLADAGGQGVAGALLVDAERDAEGPGQPGDAVRQW